GERHPPLRRGAPICEHVLDLRDLAWRGFSQEITQHGPVGGRFARRNEVFEMRAQGVRHPAQLLDRDVALAALELGDIAFGNAGNLRQHLARHAAQRAHGADALAELLKKAGFGIAMFGHVPSSVLAAKATCFGNIMPERIDSKRAQCLSMNYNSENSGEDAWVPIMQ